MADYLVRSTDFPFITEMVDKKSDDFRASLINASKFEFRFSHFSLSHPHPMSSIKKKSDLAYLDHGDSNAPPYDF